MEYLNNLKFPNKQKRNLKDEWEKEFTKFPGQLEFSIDTNLKFGKSVEFWFPFKGRIIRWINQDEHCNTILIVPVINRDNDKEEYRIAMKFLSYLSFDVSLPMKILHTCGCSKRFVPMLRAPKNSGKIVYPEDFKLNILNDLSEKEELGYSFFREGISAASIYYSFLNYYKIIQLVCNENDQKLKEWINNFISSDKLKYAYTSQRVAELKKQNKNIAKHLMRSGRLAIAHAIVQDKKGRKSKAVDPDNPDDRKRVSKDIPIVEELARYILEKRLLKSS